MTGVPFVGWALAGRGRGMRRAWWFGGLGAESGAGSAGRGLSSAGDEGEAAVAVEFEEIVDGALEPPLRAAGGFAA